MTTVEKPEMPSPHTGVRVMSSLIDRVEDLLLQATTERSHYYTANVLRDVLFELRKNALLPSLVPELVGQLEDLNKLISVGAREGMNPLKNRFGERLLFSQQTTFDLLEKAKRVMAACESADEACEGDTNLTNKKGERS